jgi:TRAP-type C4-dicarboxylate transport system permease large subunit
MEDQLTRFVEDLVGRIGGPMSFRLVIQPMMAVVFAILDGRQDALEGRVPYFWALFTDPGHRRELLRDGWKSVGKIFIIAIVLDGIYQYMVLGWFYPGEALVVAFVLALVPYLLLRGPVNRLLFWKAKKARMSSGSSRR